MSTVTASEPLPTAQSVSPEPAVQLEYGRPTPRAAGSWRDLLIGIVICLAAAVGAGCLSFGILVANSIREQYATVIAVGISFLTLAIALAVLLLIARFSRR